MAPCGPMGPGPVPGSAPPAPVKGAPPRAPGPEAHIISQARCPRPIYIYVYIYTYVCKVLDDMCARTVVMGKSDMEMTNVAKRMYSDRIRGGKKRHENIKCLKKGVLGPNAWRENAT